MPNAIDILLEDHRKAKDAFRKIEEAEGEEKESLFTALATDLKAHVQLEKEVFYPRIIQKIGTDEIQQYIEGQHEEETEGTRLLQELEDLGVDDDEFDTKFRVFRDIVLKHATTEEEQGLFPVVKRKTSTRDLDELGREMQRRHEELHRQMEARAR